MVQHENLVVSLTKTLRFVTVKAKSKRIDGKGGSLEGSTMQGHMALEETEILAPLLVGDLKKLDRYENSDFLCPNCCKAAMRHNLLVNDFICPRCGFNTEHTPELSKIYHPYWATTTEFK